MPNLGMRMMKCKRNEKKLIGMTVVETADGIVTMQESSYLRTGRLILL